MVGAAFQGIGDKLTAALLSGDFALYRTLVALPLTITPRTGETYVIADEAALKLDFDLYHMVLGVNGVTDIFRDVVESTQVSAHDAEIKVMTHILEHANRVADPFVTRFFLADVGGRWVIREIESSPEHINWTLGKTSPGFGWV